MLTCAGDEFDPGVAAVVGQQGGVPADAVVGHLNDRATAALTIRPQLVPHGGLHGGVTVQDVLPARVPVNGTRRRHVFS